MIINNQVFQDILTDEQLKKRLIYELLFSNSIFHESITVLGYVFDASIYWAVTR